MGSTGTRPATGGGEGRGSHIVDPPPPSLFNPISPLFTPIPGTGGGRPVALCSRRASEGVPVVGGSLRGTRWAAGGAGAPFCWGKIKGGNWKGVWGTPKRRVFIWGGGGGYLKQAVQAGVHVLLVGHPGTGEQRYPKSLPVPTPPTFLHPLNPTQAAPEDPPDPKFSLFRSP